jgi:hypothetical protein
MSVIQHRITFMLKWINGLMRAHKCTFVSRPICIFSTYISADVSLSKMTGVSDGGKQKAR